MSKQKITARLGILSLISFIIFFSILICKSFIPDFERVECETIKPIWVVMDESYSSYRNNLLKRIDSLAFSQKDNAKLLKLNEHLIWIINEQNSLRKENNYQVQATECYNQTRIIIQQKKEDEKSYSLWIAIFGICTAILLISCLSAIKFIKSDKRQLNKKTHC